MRISDFIIPQALKGNRDAATLLNRSNIAVRLDADNPSGFVAFDRSRNRRKK